MLAKISRGGGPLVSKGVQIQLSQQSLRPFFLLALLFFLTVLDGHFTFLHLMRGAIEVNPLLDWALERWGISGMFWLKFAITVPCLMILKVCIRLAVAQRGIILLVAVYLGLGLYHIWGLVLSPPALHYSRSW